MDRYSKFAATVMIALFIGLSARMAGAQDRSTEIAVIPFSFTVDNQVLPAGRYEVVKLSTHALRLRKLDGGKSVDLLVYPVDQQKASESSQLRFGHYGSHYFLHEFSPVASNGSVSAVRCIRTKEEKKVATTWASVQGSQQMGQQEVAISVSSR